MTNMFYRAFEDRYRGSFDLIKSRLEIYLPFIKPLKALEEKPCALDLGCGRGEWMALLQEQGFQIQGVDLDDGMLQACRAKELDVVLCDALEYIKSLPDESMSLISAFHFVEHIPFAVLQQIVDEAHRVLKPGGLLILETPNSESLLVGTSSFYLDPTHERPLPAALLSFVTEYAKFARVKTLFLQEPLQLNTEQQIGLNNVLEGVSPDYAVVSQKHAEASICALFDAPFEHEYGVRLLPLAKRYDQQVEAHVQSWQNKWELAQQKIEQLSQRTNCMDATLAAAQQKMEQLNIELKNQLQSHAEWLQTSLDVIKQKEEFLKMGEMSLLLEKQRAEKQDIELTVMSQQNEQLRMRAEWLENELDTRKPKDELDQRPHQIETILFLEKQKMEKLEIELNLSQEHNKQLQTQAFWQENELKVAKQKIKELNQSVQDWWLIADKFNQELQCVYASIYWKITWPLRKIMTIRVWISSLFLYLIKQLSRLPKFIVKSMKAWLIRRIPLFYRLKAFAMKKLNQHPRLKHFIYRLVARTGLMNLLLRFKSRLIKMRLESGNYSIPTFEESSKSLSLRATQFYNALQAAIEKKD